MKWPKKIIIFIAIVSIPFSLLAAEFQVKVIENESDLPEKFCPIWSPGDYLITDGNYLILIGGKSRRLFSNNSYYVADAVGSLIGMVPAGQGQDSKMTVGAPYFQIDGERRFIDYTTVDPKFKTAADGTLTIKATATYKEGKDLAANIETLYTLVPGTGRIDIQSTVTNTGKTDFEKLQYSVYFNSNHSYNFNPYNRRSHPELRFSVYPKGDHFLGWMDRSPLPGQGEILPGTLAPGEAFEVEYSLLVHADASDLLENLYAFTNVKPEKATVRFRNYDGDLAELIIRDALSGRVFFRSFFQDTYAYDVLLPEGIYQAQANFFPAADETIFSVHPDTENTCELQNPQTTAVTVKITNSKGEHVPGKVTFIGLDPTPSPYFEPENPVENGRNWETSKNSCYPPEEGLGVEIQPGTYFIYASRGPEYTVDQKILEITIPISNREQTELTFVIDKVVDTGKFISVDPHMHTINSDGRVDIAERIKSVIAEGVNVAISTDHNYIIDYEPTLKKLGLDKYLALITGCEVTKGGNIHYNTYPVVLLEGEELNGAVDAHSTEATPLFKASRKKDPQAILQVNHPRSGTLGYFNNYQLDLLSAASAQTNFDTSFDIMEGMNGPYFYSSNYTAILDWFHLMNRGYYFPIVGSSDSHTIARGEPGYSRTYVYYEKDQEEELDFSALLEGIKKGHSFSSNGPIIDYSINSQYIPGDSFTATGGKVNVGIQVQCAPWISLTEVRIIVNGERKVVLNASDQNTSIVRLFEEIGLTLTEDSSVAVEALGGKSLFPVLQAQASQGRLMNATLPYALTNPVFVDVDGNGQFDPPLTEKIQLKEMEKPTVIIQRY
jgi:hypothetical protein